MPRVLDSGESWSRECGRLDCIEQPPRATYFSRMTPAVSVRIFIFHLGWAWLRWHRAEFEFAETL